LPAADSGLLPRPSLPSRFLLSLLFPPLSVRLAGSARASLCSSGRLRADVGFFLTLGCLALGERDGERERERERPRGDPDREIVGIRGVTRADLLLVHHRSICLRSSGSLPSSPRLAAAANVEYRWLVVLARIESTHPRNLSRRTHRVNRRRCALANGWTRVDRWTNIARNEDLSYLLFFLPSFHLPFFDQQFPALVNSVD